jgi:hypothetical protein
MCYTSKADRKKHRDALQPATSGKGTGASKDHLMRIFGSERMD